MRTIKKNEDRLSTNDNVTIQLLNEKEILKYILIKKKKEISSKNSISTNDDTLFLL